MKVEQSLGVATISLCLFLASANALLAQTPLEPMGGPLGPPVTNAPFSADATTTVRQVLADGTRIERIGRARYFRDRIGRVRVEQEILGLEALNAAADGQTRITILPDPTTGAVYTLDPVARTVALGVRSTASSAVGGGQNFAVPLGGPHFLTFGRADQSFERYGIDSNAVDEESLGSQRIAGVETTGRRITTTIPGGSRIGNDRPFQIVDERWESTELKLLIFGRHSDPRTGVVEYRVANVRRIEPPPQQFQIPADYTVLRTTHDNPWISLTPAEHPRAADPLKKK
jgi:hypothetical protein